MRRPIALFRLSIRENEKLHMIPVTKQSKVNAYDETPYESHPHANSRPDYLRTVGRLFGMNPPAVETARVLELGCAEGGNILPHATKYPKAEFIGVDLSKVQIDAGKKHIKGMRLKNIELKHMSIADVDESFGEFDYIICHGVISWVPDFIRGKIFDACSKNLSPQGIAYISYNTLPGWNMIRTIRDMMLYHGQMFTHPEEKIAQSRSLLNFVNETLQGSTTPYALMLKEEADMLSQQDDYYLRHDHLEEENKQFYFSEFISEANQRGLQYLSDCKISSMFTGNLPQQAAEKLSEITDIIRAEQYMDFITNRRFRHTLLCHGNVAINRRLNYSMARNFAMSANVFTDNALNDVDLEKNESITFYFDKKKVNTISTRSAVMKAILYTLIETQMRPLSFNQIVQRANDKLKKTDKAKIEAELENNAIMMLIKGVLELSSETSNYSKINLDKPKLSKMALYQIKNTPKHWVTNKMHNSISINYFDRLAGKHMNGRNTASQILEKLVEDAKAEKFTLVINEEPVTENKSLKQNLSDVLNKTINKFFKNALLV